MNRLVIIGNGFDLAHDLPTSYSHFIEDYFIEAATIFLKNEKYEDELISINYFNGQIIVVKPNFNSKKEVFAFFKTYSNILKIKYKNSFFETLINEVKITNWVDIENEYYRLLKIKINLNSLKKEEKKEEKKDEVKKLND